MTTPIMTPMEASLNPDWAGLQKFLAARRELEEKGWPWEKPKEAKEAHRWNPYSFEGGTMAAVAGEDWAILASDSRMSVAGGHVIRSRGAEKVWEVSPGVGFGGCMFYGDMIELKRVLEAESMQFQFDFQREWKADEAAQLLSRLLYNRRLFPYYAWTMVGGIDGEGKGAVYSYDPIGCIERVPYVVAGSGRGLVETILHDRITGIGQIYNSTTHKPPPPLGLDEATELLKAGMIAATERESGTGDSIHLLIFKKGQPSKHTRIPLRED